MDYSRNIVFILQAIYKLLFKQKQKIVLVQAQYVHSLD